MTDRRTARRSAAVLLAVLAALPVAVPAAGAGTIRVVDDDGRGTAASCDAATATFKRIQKAVDASGAGDTVRVCPGVYAERVTITGARSGLLLVASTPLGATIRDPGGWASPQPPVVAITAVSGVTVRGFRVRALTDATYDAWDTDGIVATGAASVTIRGNHVSWSGPGGWSELAGGIVARGGTTGVIRANTIVDATNAGILVGDPAYAGTSVTVRGNTVEALFPGINSSEPPVLALYAGWGISVTNATATLTANTVTGKTVYGMNTTMSYGIEVTHGAGFGGAPSTISGNTVMGATVGIRARGLDHVLAENTVTSRQTAISLSNMDSGAVGPGNVAKATWSNAGSIWVSGDSDGNLITGNDFRTSPGTDCTDAGGTPLGNTWTDNLGADASPAGICASPTPPPPS